MPQGTWISVGRPHATLEGVEGDHDPYVVKRVLDGVLALIILVASLPILALAAVLVKLSSPGPLFYTQRRVGYGGRDFLIYKLRTMRHRCEDQSGICWSSKGDPRVTPIGRLLRKTHLDELPQLWNIVRGEMSLVGPRPERPEFVSQLVKVLPGYDERVMVRPGLTGLAQVQLDPDTDIESVRRKLICDLHYVEHGTLLLDLKLMAGTAFLVLGVPFAWYGPVLGIPSLEKIAGTGSNSDSGCGPMSASTGGSELDPDASTASVADRALSVGTAD